MKPSLRQQLERLALRLSELDATPRRPGHRRRHEALSRAEPRARRSGRAGRDFSPLRAARARSARPRASCSPSRRRTRPWRRWPAKKARPRRPTSSACGQALQAALLPRDADDGRNVFLEIRAGTGGDESALFAADLARMYLRFAERQGWKSEVMSESPSDLRRLQGNRLSHRRRFGLCAAEIRVGRPSRAARSRHRDAGPHPHQRLHRRRAARARRGRRADARSERAAHRHLSRQRRRRPARQQDRQRDPHHASADRHRRRMPGRPLAAPQQGQGDGGADGAPAREGALRARRQGSGDAQGPDRQRRPQRSHPHLQLRRKAASPTTASA